MEDDLHRVIRRGVWEEFAHLGEFQRWPAFLASGGTNQRAQGARLLENLLRDSLKAWNRECPRESHAMKLLLGLDHRGHTVLNGPSGRRAAAGRIFNDVGWDQFSRQYEHVLVERFADFLQTWRPEPGRVEASIQTFTFSDFECTAVHLHRRLEQEFSPDMVITMSGPGSFAACYMMRLNVRDIPVVVALTFPRRDVEVPAERDIAAAARATGALHLTTSKWSIYLPSLVRHVPVGYRIALVDDRVLSGESHLVARRALTNLGYEVASAALYASPTVPIADLIVGRQISGPFQMPWGPPDNRY